MKHVHLTFLEKLRHIVSKSALTKLMFICGALLIGVSIVLHLAEHGNEGYETYPRTLVTILILFMSGFDIRAPESALGTVSAFLVLLLGITFVGMFTGHIAAYFVEQRLKGGAGMLPVTCSNHIVITRWSKDTEAIIDELLSPDLKEHREIVVIDKNLQQLPIDVPLVHFVKGDPTESAVLERAGIARAKTAIILADSSSTDYNAEDSKNILIVLAIESMNPEVYTCVQILNPENRKHLERAHADEIICTTELGTKLVVHSSLSPGLSRIFTNVLSFGEGSEIYRVKLSPRYSGKTYRGLAMELSQERAMTLLALESNGDIHINPQKDLPIKEGDHVFVLSEDFPTELQK